jgi:1-deoxy-D-xylulose-5-phosphate synthase
MPLLERIQNPSDLKKLQPDELPELAEEIRQVIIHAVSRNGGHLASNLGVVELTLALHYVFNFGKYPEGPDRLLFDVGHQCYPHKIITGRARQFDALRKKGSISGFPAPSESPFDLFSVGHAGTAISTAIGLAKADALRSVDSRVVALVGDASMVNGLSLEGLNHAGALKRQMLIILNDNNMSISSPQGAFAQYLERLRVSSTYDEAKRVAERLMGRLPSNVAHTVESVWHHVKEGLKSAVWPGQPFESFGLKYFGPIDGHDLPALLEVLAELKDLKTPAVLHVQTVKGQGYKIAAEEPTRFHSPSSFKINGQDVEFAPPSGKSWTIAFADALTALARQDERVFALTAAMPDGTGLTLFEKECPGRSMDVGISESHLAAMAAGMCKAGIRPYCAVYSTFTQRAFDQIWQEITLQSLPVVFCMDRSGFVGDDGAVHHGFMDQAFLRPMPGMVLMAPSDEAELNRAMRLTLQLDGPSAIRYPRDSVPARNFEASIDPSLRAVATAEWQPGVSRRLRAGSDATLIVYGALATQAMAAAEQLAAAGRWRARRRQAPG